MAFAEFTELLVNQSPTRVHFTSDAMISLTNGVSQVISVISVLLMLSTKSSVLRLTAVSSTVLLAEDILVVPDRVVPVAMCSTQTS